MTAPSRSLTAVDLFCGAGGLSAGLSEAGFDVVWAIDGDAAATETFAANHEVTAVTGDIREIDPGDISLDERSASDGTARSAVDLVAGGPPCPTHSHVGRNRLNGRSASDERHSLYEEFIRFVERLRPTAFLMENVPGMTHSETASGFPVVEDITRRCEGLGYRVSVESVDAVDYGVPQHRERVFIIGNDRGVANPHLPAWRTHREPRGERERGATIIGRDEDAPASASGTSGADAHQMTLAMARDDSSIEADGGTDADIGTGAESRDGTLPLPGRDVSPRPWNTVADALTDLPEASTDAEPVEYAIEALTPFQRWVRTDDGTGVGSHTGRTPSKRDRALYALLGDGVGYSIEHLPESLCPHGTDSFPDKYRKLRPNRPSGTVIAHISKGGHRFIHPRIPRSITVREAARLQSFPDEFVFPVAQTSAYRQIGNAVPPLVARALGTALVETVFDCDERKPTPQKVGRCRDG